jgi:hypothetical protein
VEIEEVVAHLADLRIVAIEMVEMAMVMVEAVAEEAAATTPTRLQVNSILE